MKKQKESKIFIVILVIILLLMLLASIPAQTVEAQGRDGGDPVLDLGICAFIEDSRDGVSIFAGHWIDLNENLEPYTEIFITLSGYDNPAYWDFGLPEISGKENTYSLSPGFLYGWTRSPYELGNNPQELSVTINGITTSIGIPTYIQAFEMLENGEIPTCPNPWPEPVRLHKTFFPLFLNGQN